MKKTLLILAAVAFSFGTAFAQETVIDRPADVSTGLISSAANDGSGVFTADYFELDEETYLGEFTFFGFASAPIEANITGFNILIFEDDGFGSPDGNPSWDDSGAVLELKDIDLADFEMESETTGTTSVTVTVDIATANNDQQVNLEAGNYWVSAYPTFNVGINDLGDDATRWNWLGSSVEHDNLPVLIDPLDLFGEGATFWFPIEELIGDDFTSFAWKLTSADPLGVEDFETNTFKHLVSNNQLLINSDLEINNVAIYNSLGQQVVSQTVNTTSANINLSNLSSGVYFTQANLNGETKTFKFVK